MTIVICSKARLAEYGLDDTEDSVANFLILSLQNDQMSPALQVRIPTVITAV